MNQKIKKSKLNAVKISRFYPLNSDQFFSRKKIPNRNSPFIFFFQEKVKVHPEILANKGKTVQEIFALFKSIISSNAKKEEECVDFFFYILQWSLTIAGRDGIPDNSFYF